MAKSKHRRTSFRELNEPTDPKKPIPKSASARPIRWDLIALFLLISIGGSYLVMALRKPMAPQFTYKVLKSYPHDPDAFTQGLMMHDGFLWESTGKKGKSSFRKIDLETGQLLQNVIVDDQYFAEGLAFLNDQFFQLTWQDEVCFVYDKSMKKVREFPYEGEGWGLTTDGVDLIMSDGSSALRFMDPETFKEKRRINVRVNGMRAGVLNELEYVGGKVFANVWMRDVIYEIDPQTGNVDRQIDLSGLWPVAERPEEGVLNGIAFNPKSKKLLVTGKLALKIWEIDVVPVKK
jgi:glutaminyl-peptide cyclotransferase